MSDTKQNLEELINNLIYQRYRIGKDNTEKIFAKLNLQEYVALQTISLASKESEGPDHIIYLRELAEVMQIPIAKASRMAHKLTDRGLVIWQHDGKGHKGTYLSISDHGYACYEKQHQMIRDFFGKAIEEYGVSNLVKFLKLAKQLEDIMSAIEVEE